MNPFILERMLNAQTLILPGIEIVGALIFDFDGVIADSEAIANTVLACSCAFRCWHWKRNSAVMSSAPIWSREESRTRTSSCLPQASWA